MMAVKARVTSLTWGFAFPFTPIFVFGLFCKLFKILEIPHSPTC